RWVATLANSANADVDIVYVKPRQGKFLKAAPVSKENRDVDKTLASFASELKKSGVSSSRSILKSSGSTAQTIIQHSAKRKSGKIVTICTRRKGFRRLLMGSTERRVLSLTKRPFLSVRFGKN